MNLLQIMSYKIRRHQYNDFPMMKPANDKNLLIITSPFDIVNVYSRFFRRSHDRVSRI